MKRSFRKRKFICKNRRKLPTKKTHGDIAGKALKIKAFSGVMPPAIAPKRAVIMAQFLRARVSRYDTLPPRQSCASARHNSVHNR